MSHSSRITRRPTPHFYFFLLYLSLCYSLSLRDFLLTHCLSLAACSAESHQAKRITLIIPFSKPPINFPSLGCFAFERFFPHLSSISGFSIFPLFWSALTKGGPHNNTIEGVAVCLKHAQSPEFKIYQTQVVSNCKALAAHLIELGYKLVSGGSDNHLVLVDLGPLGIDGARLEKILDMSSITLNKNSVPGDKSALVPGGIRIGTPALTTRGFKEKDFLAVADLIHEGVQIALEAKGSASGTKDFMDYVESPDFSLKGRIADLKRRVEDLATQFPMPGV